MANVDFNITVSPNTLYLGQSFHYITGLTFPANLQLISVPDKTAFASANGFELIDSDIQKQQSNDMRYVYLDYHFLALNLGPQTISTQSIILSNQDSGKYTKIAIPPQQLTIRSNFNQNEKAELKLKLNVYLEKLNWKKYAMFFLVTTIIILSIIFVIYRFILNKQKVEELQEPIPVDPRSALEIALDDIDTLFAKNLYAKNQLKEHYINLSDIIKLFLGNVYKEHMIEMTSSEVTQLCHKKLNTNLFQKLKNILSFSDYIKFAKQIPSENEHLEQKEKTIELIQKIWDTEQKITENYTEDPLK